MKQIIQRIAFMLLCAVGTQQLVADSSCCDCNYDCTTFTKCQKRDCSQCHSVYIPRSTHSNSAYFWLPPVGMADNKAYDWRAAGDVGIEFQQSFKESDLAKCLFGKSTLHFQGSLVPNRDSNALIADNFGLSYFFDGSITFRPKIQNVNLHFQKRLYLDCWHENSWVQLNFTFTHQKRNLFGKDCICDPIATGTSNNVPFITGYMDMGQNVTLELVTLAPLTGGTVFPASGLKQALSGDFTFGTMQSPWKFGRFLFDYQTANKVAGVSLLFGYDFCKQEDRHVGLFFQWTAPTGNTPNPTYVFAPVIGNGKHNEIGAGIDAHWDFYNGDCGNFSLYLNGNVTTMLKNCQVRSFDFINRGCMSRYLLLKQLVPNDPILFRSPKDPISGLNTSGSFSSSGLPAGFISGGNMINGINFTTRFVQVKVPVKGDASLRVAWQRDCYNFAIGYNIYGQSSERLCIKPGSPCSAIDQNAHYGIKGCTGIATYGYTVVSGSTLQNGPQFSVFTSSTANATITDCGAVDNPGSQLSGEVVAYVDWKNGLNGAAANAVPVGTAVSSLVLSQVSLPMKEVTIGDLDILSGISPKQIIHKGFVTATHNWNDSDYKPFVTLGAEVEGNSGACYLKQWGLWIKAGATF